jgi:hypothetical protein
LGKKFLSIPYSPVKKFYSILFYSIFLGCRPAASPGKTDANKYKIQLDTGSSAKPKA